MGLGLAMFKQLRKENKHDDMEVVTPLAYPTGFMPMDYANGHIVEVRDDDDNIVETYDSVGLVGGTLVTFIADSGLGKTTSAQQIAVNIVSPFPEAFVIHEDIEQSGHADRIYQTSNKKAKWIKEHYSIYQDTQAETVVSRFNDHATLKLNNRKEFEYNTGLRDMYGDEMKSLVPTVVLIDSLAVMRSGAIDFTTDAEKTTGNMEGARNAKFNGEVLQRMLPIAKKANILIFVINHIKRKVETGFVKSARDLVGLGENETLPGELLRPLQEVILVRSLH